MSTNIKVFEERDEMPIASILNDEGIGAMPTDTIYGLLGKAGSPKVVERIYKIKNRDKNKPFIILISAVEEIPEFEISISQREKVFLNQLWPDKVSVVLSNPGGKFEYLHRGKNSLAFRIPTSDYLVKLIKKVGPLVAPSANAQGEKVIRHSHEAIEKFGNAIDFVVKETAADEEDLLPSTLVKLTKENFEMLREGRVSEVYIKEVWENS